MDSGGIATALLSISSPGTHFGPQVGGDAGARDLTRHVNDAGAEIRRARPDRFGHFAYPRFETLFAELDRRRTPVFVHPTSPPNAEVISLGRPRPMLEFLFDSARAVSDLVFTGVLVRHPRIPWVFTHGAGVLPLVAERMELFRQLLPAAAGPTGDPVPEQIARLWFDLAGTPFPHQVPAAAAAFGTERLLYGSDYCWTPAPAALAQLASIDSAPQPEDDSWRALTTRNAERLLPRLARESEHA